MYIEVIQQVPQMEALAEEWNTLLDSSASHVPFLRHEYQSAWWETLGGGEWAEGELYIVTGRAEDGQLVGIAPLFITQNRQAERVLMLLGSIEISDYLDIIARPEDLAPFIHFLLDHLSSREAPNWHALDLVNLLESSPTLPILQEEAQRRGWRLENDPLQHCPHIPLPGSWEQYLMSIDKKQRHEIRRKLRRAYEYEAPVQWKIVAPQADLDAEMEAFFVLMAYDEEKARFLTPAMRTQMKKAVRAAAHAGWLQLSFIEVGGEKAAAYLNFDYANQIWVYNSGFNPRFRELSVGWVLLAELIQWAISQGRQTFDFMRGDEDYKYRFGGIDRKIVRAVLRC